MIVTLAAILLAQVIVSPATLHILTSKFERNLTPISNIHPVKKTTPTESVKCRENMILVESQGGKLCKCYDGFVRYRPANSCHRMFTQGSCPKSHYIYQPLNETVATCVKNPCKKLETFPAMGKGCFELTYIFLSWINSPKKHQLLSVNLNTNQFELTKWPEPNREAIEALKTAVLELDMDYMYSNIMIDYLNTF